MLSGMTRRFDPTRIKALRGGLGWTAEELADRIGVARQTVYAWESGQYEPTLSKLMALVNETGAKLESFFIADERQTA